ncbi:MAB_1171c family putative transporter [Actinoplanes sp. NPDC023714]|uniref:MAB_1171c family putative transporter n=1 Tax=Actinoplanes sp. NPDC023714 TaxID=3154322 RepID=UPI00340FA89E
MIASAAVTVLLWVTVLARLPNLRRTDSPGMGRQRLLWANLLFCALAASIALPALAGDRPVPAAAHLCALVAAQLLLSFVCLVTGTGRPWVQWSLTGAMMTVMVVSAVPETPDDPFRSPAATEVTYWAVFHGYLAFLMLLNARACTIIGRAAPAGYVRRGILTMGNGILLIALYALVKTLLIGAWALFPVRLDLTAWEPWLVTARTAGALLYLFGGAVPAAALLGPVLAAYRSLIVLRPLWSAMRTAFPEVVLMPPARAALPLTGVGGVRLRLYRRVIEIRDGLLALRPYLPAGCPERVGDPAVEAQRILVALRQRETGLPPDGTPGRWAPVGPSMDDEVAWLSQVSRAYRKGLSRPDARTPRPSGSPR